MVSRRCQIEMPFDAVEPVLDPDHAFFHTRRALFHSRHAQFHAIDPRILNRDLRVNVSEMRLKMRQLRLKMRNARLDSGQASPSLLSECFQLVLERPLPA